MGTDLQDLYPIAVLIHELRSDDQLLRRNAMRQMSTIATALGEERTRSELIPFLQELVEDDSEDPQMLILLCEELGRAVPLVGGPEHAHCLLGPLEDLAVIEEQVVRETAVAALKDLAKGMPEEHLSGPFLALIQRMTGRESFTSKVSACGLVPVALGRVSKELQDDLLPKYLSLCTDGTPMVRRAAASVLCEVLTIMANSEAWLESLLEVLRSLLKQEQESVRVLAIDNCIALGQICPVSVVAAEAVPCIRASAQDRAWTVRSTVADRIPILLVLPGPEARVEVLSSWRKLLADSEPEVRTTAAKRLSAGITAVTDKHDLFQALLPDIQALTKDTCPHVRGALARGVLKLGAALGKEVYEGPVMGLVLELLKDEAAEVRLELVTSFSEAGLDTACVATLLPAVTALYEDKQWRVRQAMLSFTPRIARELGERMFMSTVGPACLKMTTDNVCAVRQSAGHVLRSLCEVLGPEWSREHVYQHITKLAEHKSYLNRIAALLCVSALHETGDNQVVSDDDCCEIFVPVVRELASDRVPNVRFNAGSAAVTMWKRLPTTTAEAELGCIFLGLEQDDDNDVKFFAAQAVKSLKS